MRFAGGLFYPEAEDPGGADPDDRCVIQLGPAAGHVYRFRGPADLQEAHPPRLGRLSREEFDARIGQVLVSRTYAGMAAVSAAIPGGLARASAPPRRVGKAAR